MAKTFAAIAGRAIRTGAGKSESRTKMIQAVRAACRRLGLDDDARRDMQVGVVGKASMTDMTLDELGTLLDRLNKDWKGPAGHRAHVGKIRALWWTLYWLAAVEEPNDRAIDAFVRRQTGVSALRFLDHRTAPAVVEALKSWAAREGVAWLPRPDDMDDRRAVLSALATRLGVVSAGQLLIASGLGAPSADWTRHQFDAAIRLLGKQVRKTAGDLR